MWWKYIISVSSRGCQEHCEISLTKYIQDRELRWCSDFVISLFNYIKVCYPFKVFAKVVSIKGTIERLEKVKIRRKKQEHSHLCSMLNENFHLKISFSSPNTAQKKKFFIKDFLRKCDLTKFTEKIINGKLHFLCSENLNSF